MKYIFFGTPEFAAIILEKLIGAGYAPLAVVCNPDEPAGRKQMLTPPPAKILAQKHGIIIFQPEKLKDNQEFAKRLQNLETDLAVVAAYGKILPKEILEIPRFGFINVHPSLLPKYRGASPIQYAIFNGEKETGATIMKIDEQMDHGGIILNIKCQISKTDTYESLSQKLAVLGAQLLIKVVPDYISGKIKPMPQEHEKATYTKILKKEDGKIDWAKSAEKIERMTRAHFPWPSAWATYNGKILKILESKLSNSFAAAKLVKLPAGKVFLNNKKELLIKCNGGVLIVRKLQLEGGKILSAKDFLNGHKNLVGSILK